MTAGILVIEIQVPNHRGIDESRRLGGRSFSMEQDPTRITLRHGAARKPKTHASGLAIAGGNRASQAIDQILCRGRDDFVRKRLVGNVRSEICDLAS